MSVKISQSKNKISVGKQEIELSLDEMNELYEALRKVLAKPLPQIPITYAPYKPTIIEDGPINPEKPWIDEQIPKRFPLRPDHYWLVENISNICNMTGQ